MTNVEFPPQKKLTDLPEEEQQEHLRSIEAIKQQKIDEQVHEDNKEKTFNNELGKQTINNSADIERVLNEAVKIAEETANKMSPKPMEPELIIEDELDKEAKEILNKQVSSKPKSGVLNKITTSILAFLGFGAAAHAGTLPEKSLPDSGKKIERKIDRKAVSDTVQEGKTTVIPLYTKSKTLEGGITPTGFNNSFYENEFGIKESDIAAIAKEYGFRTISALDFQVDLIEYMKQHHPEIIDEVLKKYGETNFSEETGKKGVEGLKDAKLGVRTAFILSQLKKSTPSNHPETGPTSSGGEIFNTDGYQKLVVLFDNSPSMYAHREFLASDLKDNISKVPVEVIGFSNKADTTMTLESPKAASEVLKTIKIVDQNKELAVNELRKKLQSMEIQTGKTKIVVCTDEALQEVTREKLNDLQKLSAEKNVDLVFSIIINEKPYKLTLEDVEDSFEKMLSEFNRQIEIRKGIIQEAQKALGDGSSKEKKRLEKEIKEAQSESEYFQNFINGSKSLDISDFETPKNKSSIARK